MFPRESPKSSNVSSGNRGRVTKAAGLAAVLVGLVLVASFSFSAKNKQAVGKLALAKSQEHLERGAFETKMARKYVECMEKLEKSEEVLGKPRKATLVRSQAVVVNEDNSAVLVDLNLCRVDDRFEPTENGEVARSVRELSESGSAVVAGDSWSACEVYSLGNPLMTDYYYDHARRKIGRFLYCSVDAEGQGERGGFNLDGGESGPASWGPNYENKCRVAVNNQEKAYDLYIFDPLKTHPTCYGGKLKMTGVTRSLCYHECPRLGTGCKAVSTGMFNGNSNAQFFACAGQDTANDGYRGGFNLNLNGYVDKCVIGARGVEYHSQDYKCICEC